MVYLFSVQSSPPDRHPEVELSERYGGSVEDTSAGLCRDCLSRALQWAAARQSATTASEGKTA